MKGYVIAEIEITDPATFQEYGRQVPATIAKFGGRYLVRGGSIEAVEGGWNPRRLVVLEFPSMDQARKWYHSEEYKPLIALRQKGSRGKLVFVEGYQP